jgi:ribosomal protein L11 methyltransferase
MSNYIQIQYDQINQEQTEMLIAQLAAIGYEGFVEEENSLQAFIPEKDFVAQTLIGIDMELKVQSRKSTIAQQNWNALWESNFEPVQVDEFVGIRAHFHPSFTKVQHEILITPKMSFGTGHHATTYLMMKQMQSIDFNDKTVFDFGTGTGVLAILAEKLNAASIEAIDNDDWSVENGIENAENNHCTKIKLYKEESLHAIEAHDIVLANINKHVLLANAKELFHITNNILLISGLLVEDEADIITAFQQEGFLHQNTMERNGWICILLNK